MVSEAVSRVLPLVDTMGTSSGPATLKTRGPRHGMSLELGVGDAELGEVLGVPEPSGRPDGPGAGEDGSPDGVAVPVGSGVAGGPVVVLGSGSGSACSLSPMPSRSPTPSTSPFQPSTIGLPVPSPSSSASASPEAEAEGEAEALAVGVFFAAVRLGEGLAEDWRAASFLAAAAGRDGRPSGHSGSARAGVLLPAISRAAVIAS